MRLSTLTIDSDDIVHPVCIQIELQSLVLVLLHDDVIRPWHACTVRVRTVVALSVCYVCLLLVISTLAKQHVLVKA